MQDDAEVQGTRLGPKLGGEIPVFFVAFLQYVVGMVVFQPLEDSVSIPSNEQLVAASTSLFAAYSQMRSSLLGNDFNDRQLAVLLLLGARQLRAQDGISAEPMTKERLEELIARQLDCDERTAKDDVDALIEEGLLEKTIGNDKRQRVITISAGGEALYRDVATQSLHIVIDAAKAVKAVGKVPKPIKPYKGFKPYFRRMNWPRNIGPTATSLVLALLILASGPSESRADAAGFLEDGLKTAAVIHHHDNSGDIIFA